VPVAPHPAAPLHARRCCDTPTGAQCRDAALARKRAVAMLCPATRTPRGPCCHFAPDSGVFYFSECPGCEAGTEGGVEARAESHNSYSVEVGRARK
jgi:hypothetical protein